MSEDNDRELEAIIHSSATQAEALYPKREMSLKMRLAIGFVAVIMLANAIVGLINSRGISSTRACQDSQSAQLTVLRNNNQTASSQWINSITDAIDQKLLSRESIDHLRDEYNRAVEKNNAAIDTVRSVKCK